MTRPEGLLLLCLVVPFSCMAADDGPQDSIDELELKRHADMLTTVRVSNAALTPFTTDGCSGGLSIGWQVLADEVDAVRAHGNSPPWERCCIEHDRDYHAAVPSDATPEGSFRARKHADQALRQCVLDTGFDRATALSNSYEVSIETVESLYTTIADLMYRAVRVGGVPCSGLPWRWGYGWPACD